MAKSQDEMGKIVDTCLGLVKTGQATPESVLAQVPDTPGGVRPQLEMALWLDAVGRALDPSPSYVLAARRRLVERIQQETRGARSPRRPSQPVPIWMFWRRERPAKTFVFQFAFTLLLLAAFLGLGQSVLQTAQSAVPGDALYVVKAAQERVQLAAALSETREAELHIHFAQRRLVEIATLILENRYEWIAEAAASYDEHVNRAVESLQKIIAADSSQVQDLAASLQDILTQQVQVVSVLSQGLPADVSQDIEQVLAVSNQNLLTVQGLLAEEGNTPLLPPSPAAPSGSPLPVTAPTSATATPDLPDGSQPVSERTAVPLAGTPNAVPTPETTQAPGSPTGSTATPVASVEPTAPPKTAQPTGEPVKDATPIPNQVEPPAADPGPKEPKEPKPTKKPKPDTPNNPSDGAKPQPPANPPGGSSPGPPSNPSDEAKPTKDANPNPPQNPAGEPKPTKEAPPGPSANPADEAKPTKEAKPPKP